MDFLFSKFFQIMLLLAFFVTVFYVQVSQVHKERMSDSTDDTYHQASWFQRLTMLVMAGDKITSAATAVLFFVFLYFISVG